MLTPLKFIIFFLYFCIFISSLFSQTATSLDKDNFINKHGDLPVQSFEIRGLKKTKETVIRNCINNKRGDALSEFNEELFKQKIYKLGIIKSTEIEYAENNGSVTVLITLTEKLTMIAIPIAFINSDGYMIGIFGMDANLFGYNKKLILGGFYGSSGWTVMSIYEDPGNSDKDFIYKMSVLTGESDTENKDLDNHTYQHYKTQNFGISLSPGYRLNRWKGYLRQAYHSFGVDNNFESARKSPESNDYYISGFSVKYDNQKYTFFRMTGLNVLSKYRHIYSLTTEDHYNRMQIIADYSFIPVWKLVSALNASAEYGNTPELMKERIAGKTSFSSLPSRNIGMNKYIGVSLTFEAPVYSNEHIAVSVINFFEEGVLSFENNYDTPYFGFGAGSKLYLKGVAFPAVGILGTYNVRSHEYGYAVSMGMM